MFSRPTLLRPARIWFSAAGGIFFLCAAQLLAAPPASVSLDWLANPTDAALPTVAVSGLTPAALRSLRALPASSSSWPRLLSVFPVARTDIGELPPMAGRYSVTASGQLHFQPDFPLLPGIRYRAEFRPSRLPDAAAFGPPLDSFFELPARKFSPSTQVAAIYPTANVLPENLLKFYVHFSAPMSQGNVYDYIQLVDEHGKIIELPFLEIAEELWNPTQTRLTLLIDPGRIKRGVQPLEEIGPALETGKSYVLKISERWPDGNGTPLAASHSKKFRVGPPDREPPDPAAWTIQAPKAGSRDPLVITFPKPMDHALALRLIRVLDPGHAQWPGVSLLTKNETEWSFVPAQPWPDGKMTVSITTTIEDLAGNNIGKPFEVDLIEPIERKLSRRTVELSFRTVK